MDLLMDLLSVHDHVLGRFDAEPHLLATNLQDDDLNIVPDHDALLQFTSENKQRRLPSVARRRR